MGGAESIRLETYGKPCWNAPANQGGFGERGRRFWVLGFEWRSDIDVPNRGYRKICVWVTT